MQHAVGDDVTGLGRDTFVVERCAAARSRQVRFLANADVRCEHRLAKRIEQERRLAVQTSAGHRVHERTDQVTGLRSLEQHRAFERAQLPRTEPTYGALAGDAAHIGRRQQVAGRARRRVPVIALHRAVGLADDGAIDRVPRAAVTPGKSRSVRVDELRFAARNARTFRVGNARIDCQRRGFRLAAELDRIVNGKVPRMVEIEIGPRARKPRRIGQPGARIFRGEARDRERLVDGRANRLVREIGRARVSAARADVHGNADTLVAVVRNRLDFTFAYRNTLADRLRHFGLGRGSATGARNVEHGCGDALERARGHGKMGFAVAQRRAGRRIGGG